MTNPGKRRWHMLTLVGPDRPDLVARISSALYESDCELGESSMARLGGQFTMMLMARAAATAHQLGERIAPVAESLGLTWHVDPIAGALHAHRLPDVSITAGGPDQAGFLARIATAMAEAGLHTLTLETDIAGEADEPVFIVHMEGIATQGRETLQAAAQVLREEGMDVHVSALDVLED